jgi:hypothetical protein
MTAGFLHVDGDLFESNSIPEEANRKRGMCQQSLGFQINP